ncbi:hypothetical protein ColTof4_14338 [Colletotrichum tofieldiae]|nr:hypothetical protein ColTof3_14749 [Colletotrichum tofieldiae]GKT81915.1 hypothetical protein ColTof4_14338 [Colletotrichum tofieldiae]
MYTCKPSPPHRNNVDPDSARQAHGLQPPPSTAVAAATSSTLHAAAAAGHNDVVAWLLANSARTERLVFGSCVCSSPHLRLLLEHALPYRDGQCGLGYGLQYHPYAVAH